MKKEIQIFVTKLCQSNSYSEIERRGGLKEVLRERERNYRKEMGDSPLLYRWFMYNINININKIKI